MIFEKHILACDMCTRGSNMNKHQCYKHCHLNIAAKTIPTIIVMTTLIKKTKQRQRISYLGVHSTMNGTGDDLNILTFSP